MWDKELWNIPGVYVYSAPTYLAQKNANGDVLMKVGRGRCCLKRFLDQQHATVAAEAQVLQRIYRAVDGDDKALEDKFHGVLDNAFPRGDGGREWWWTNKPFLDAAGCGFGAPIEYNADVGNRNDGGDRQMPPIVTRPDHQLLCDIRTVYDNAEKTVIFTTDLLDELLRLNPQWRGLQPKTLGRMLSAFNISPRTVRIGPINKKGYRREYFYEAWKVGSVA